MSWLGKSTMMKGMPSISSRGSTPVHGECKSFSRHRECEEKLEPVRPEPRCITRYRLSSIRPAPENKYICWDGGKRRGTKQSIESILYPLLVRLSDFFYLTITVQIFLCPSHLGTGQEIWRPLTNRFVGLPLIEDPIIKDREYVHHCIDYAFLTV